MQLEARGDATFQNLIQAADTLMHYALQRKELTGLSSSLQSEIPQLLFRRRSGQSPHTGSTANRYFLYNESLYRFGICKRFQHVQPYL